MSTTQQTSKPSGALTPLRVLQAYTLFEAWQRGETTPRQNILPSRVYELFPGVTENAIKQAVVDREVYCTGLWDRDSSALSIDDLAGWLDENPALFSITDEVAEFTWLVETRLEMRKRHNGEANEADARLRQIIATLSARRNVVRDQAALEAAAKTVRDQEARERVELSKTRRGRQWLAQCESSKAQVEQEAVEKCEVEAAEQRARGEHRRQREARQAALRKVHAAQEAAIAAATK